MIHSVGVKELATEKTLSVEPTSLGVRIFMHNKALEERMHIQLDLDDMIAVNRVLEKRIRDLETSSIKPTREKVGIEAMWEIIQDISENDALVVNNHIDYECSFCNHAASLREEFIHSLDCIVTKARELVAERDKGKNEMPLDQELAQQILGLINLAYQETEDTSSSQTFTKLTQLVDAIEAVCKAHVKPKGEE